MLYRFSLSSSLVWTGALSSSEVSPSGAVGEVYPLYRVSEVCVAESVGLAWLSRVRGSIARGGGPLRTVRQQRLSRVLARSWY